MADLQPGIDHIGVTVAFFCHDGKGNFVLAKRSVNARDEHHRWDNGGGKVELGDDVIKRLHDEIKEEYCADVLTHEFLGYRDVHRENQDGAKTHWVALDFKVLVDPAQVKNGEPHKFDDLQWFALDNVPPDEQLHSQLPGALQKYRQQLRS